MLVVPLVLPTGAAAEDVDRRGLLLGAFAAADAAGGAEAGAADVDACAGQLDTQQPPTPYVLVEGWS